MKYSLLLTLPLLTVGCLLPAFPPNEFGIVEPLQMSDGVLSSQGLGPVGPPDTTYSDTEVWKVTNDWTDTDTEAAKAAGLAWREDSGTSWEDKYSLWVDSLAATATYSGGATTFELETPTGKVVQAPYLECAETAYFLRAVFASWYNLPFYVEAVDGDGDRIFLGHFGFVLEDGSRYGSTPRFANYTDYSHMTAEDIAADGWPSDSNLQGRQLWGSSDEQPFLGEDAHFGAYWDELLLNKRTGYFLMLLLPYFGSIHLADDSVAWHVTPEGIRPGDLLIERWQSNGIGHVMVIKEVQWLDGGQAAAEIASGSMPRRQPKWESPTAAKMYFTSAKTGGEGDNWDGEAYVELGGGAKGFLNAFSEGGRWRNRVPTDRLDTWIPTSDTEARAARPEQFEALLAEADADELRDEILSLIESKRDHLRDHPSSCSAREMREQYFESLYDLMQRENGWDRQRTDEEYRILDDYVFAELVYSESRTCCWNSTTNDMYEVIMDYNQSMVEADPDTCVDPVVFKVEDDGYDVFEAYAVDTGRGDIWVEWSADESCPQSGVENDTEMEHGWTEYCDVEDAIGGNEGGGDEGGDEGAGSGDGSDPYEPNDSASDAATLAEGAYSGTEIAADDEDWFRVQASGASVTATITFDHDAGDLDLELLDGDGSSLETSQGTDDSESVTQSADEILIRVYGYSGATGKYDLTITVD